jgi:peptidoglycan/LPS O-acetylase OafA/YrhL
MTRQILPRHVQAATYRADIDGLRAIAVTAVVAYHVGLPLLPGGFVGVDIFFVISGYLITGLLLSEIVRSGKISLLNFYARRARRLLPTLLLVVITTVTVAVFLLSTAAGEVRIVANSAIATLLMLSNHYFISSFMDYFSVGADHQPLLHTWSLSVEEQFYLVWPTLITFTFFLRKYFASERRAFVFVVSAVSILSLIGAFILSHYNNTWAFFFAPARGWELGLGSLVAICNREIELVPERLAAFLSWIGLLLIAAAVTLVEADASFPIPAAIVPVCGTALILVGTGKCRTGYVSRFLSIPAMVAIGQASYAWYLWHWPALSITRIISGGDPNLMRDCLISGVTLILSLATLRWFENPLRRGVALNLSALRVVSVAGFAACFAVIAVGGVRVWAKSHHFGKDSEVLLQKQDMPIGTEDCLQPLHEDATLLERCLDRTSRPKLLLWGDSMANRLSPALNRWLESRGDPIGLEQITKSACPPLLNALPTLPGVRSWAPYESCKNVNLFAVSHIADSKPGPVGVILSAAWWPRATDFDLRNIDSSEARHSFDVGARSTDQSLQILEFRLRETLLAISKSGARVVLMLQSPILLADKSNKALDVPLCLLRREEHDCTMRRALHDSLSSQVNHILTAVASEFVNVKTLDLTEYLCNEEVCPGRIDGVVVYTDYEHLSASMSRALGERLAPYFNWLAGDDDALASQASH